MAMVALAAVGVGIATGFLAGAAERGLYATGLWSRGGASTLAPGTFDQPVTPAGTTGAESPTPTPQGLPTPVLAAATQGRAVSAAKVAALVESVDDEQVGGRFTASVAELESGRRVYGHRTASPAIPASTMKLFTATAVLSALGPDHEFSTRVVRSGRTVVLVGGGDPYLARTADPDAPQRATLTSLADATAAGLKRSRTTTVTLDYDASLFAGPAWNPRWPDRYADQVTPVTALWVDGGRRSRVMADPARANPPREAARAFAAALEERGITVSEVEAGRAPRGAEPVAAVRSEPLRQVVEDMLLASDNNAAEVLFRHVALAAGRPGSTTEAAKAVRAQLAPLDLWQPGMRVEDGSGLARSDRARADTLVALLRAAASPSRPELRAVLTGLPVAGVEGSLRIRFTDDASRPGRGVVRGKTGTLSQVHALAGYLRTRDGTQLAYAFVVNDAENDYAAKVWLDRVSAALSRCGC